MAIFGNKELVTGSTQYWKFYKFVVSDLLQDPGPERLAEFLLLFPQFQE